MPTQPGVAVLVDGKALGDDHAELREATIELVTNAPARATVVLSDPRLAALGQATIGAGLEVSFSDGATLRRQFTGQVVEVGIQEHHDGPSLVRVEALDPTHELGMSTAVRSFSDQTVDQVIRALVGSKLSVSGQTIGGQVPYLLLTDTAMGLLTELVARNGCTWRYDVTTSSILIEQLSLQPSSPTELAFGQDLYQLEASHSGRYVREATVRGWDPKKGSSIVHTATATVPDRGVAPKAAASWKTADASVLVAGAPVLDTKEASQLATALVTSAGLRSVGVRGEAVHLPTLVPNTWIKVTRGTGTTARTYVVDRVVHRYSHTGTSAVTTRFEGGDHPFAPATAPESPRESRLRFDALVVGIVTDNNDPDKLGRVLVRFPWLSDDHASNWARVMSFGGGKGDKTTRGAQFVPEVGDEVLVGFENGDLRQPVVLGTLYSPGTKAPAWDRDGNQVSSRSITSRVGHLLSFGDGKGPDKRFMHLALADGSTELMLSEKQITLKAKGGNPIEVVSGDAKLTFDNQGNITIKGNKITIEAQQEVAIKGQQKVAIEGGTVEAKGQAKLGLTAPQVEASGSAMLKLAGGQVMIN